MARTDDSAALAVNWRTVLAFDFILGVGVSIAGVAMAAIVNLVVGLVVVALGAAYGAAVVARARRWSRIRREAGL